MIIIGVRKVKDIELAKDILEKEDYALVVVKSGEIIFKSQEKGIRPMYVLARDMKDMAKGSAIADRVIGRGAALLGKYVGAKEIHGNLISKAAIEVYEKDNISYSFNGLCEYIKNRDGSDYCPIEKISWGIENAETFLEELEIFFNNMRTKGE